MTNPDGASGTCRCLPRAAAGLALGLAVLAPAALGQVPPGLEVGPWILAPVLRGSWSYDSNVFRQVDQSSEHDSVVQAEAGLSATLPFRASALRLDYRGNRLEYGKSNFDRDMTHNAGVELSLAFKTGDRLTLRDVYRRDILRIDLSEDVEGNEQVFQGEPFSLNRWELELDRSATDRQGYLIRVRRQDYTLDDDVATGVYEYRGFDNVFEYRQPLTTYRSWTLRYGMRRFSHFDPADSVPGQPFRREESDSLLYGLRGRVGAGQTYHVQLGYGQFRLRQSAPEEFSGLVAAVNWGLALGGRTALAVDVVRRPLPSSFDTYYINNALRVDLSRRWLRFRSRATGRATVNDYAEATAGCGGRSREDVTLGVEARQGLIVHERMEIGVGAFYERRSSNCDVSDFTANGVDVGVTVGWF